MAVPQDIKPDQITPEQFAELVSGLSDEDVTKVVRGAGTADVLDRIFEGMEQRFLPEKAKDVDADIAFEITDDGETHDYLVTVRDATCKAGRGTADSPKSRSLPRWFRLSSWWVARLRVRNCSWRESSRSRGT